MKAKMAQEVHCLNCLFHGLAGHAMLMHSIAQAPHTHKSQDSRVEQRLSSRRQNPDPCTTHHC